MSVLKALVGCEGLAFAPLRISASKDVLARRGQFGLQTQRGNCCSLKRNCMTFVRNAFPGPPRPTPGPRPDPEPGPGSDPDIYPPVKSPPDRDPEPDIFPPPMPQPEPMPM